MKVLAFAGFSALLLVSGCAIGAASVATVQDKSIGQGVDDSNASTELKSKLFGAGPSRFGDVDIEVVDGLALLTGRVDNAYDKQDVERLAKEVRRISSVANELNVAPKGGINLGLNDDWIASRVRSSLVGDASVKSLNYNISTYNGIVYLMGTARSEEELRTATQIASLVKGVREVVSYVKVMN